jgi:hypothetical protein
MVSIVLAQNDIKAQFYEQDVIFCGVSSDTTGDSGNTLAVAIGNETFHPVAGFRDERDQAAVSKLLSGAPVQFDAQVMAYWNEPEGMWKLSLKNDQNIENEKIYNNEIHQSIKISQLKVKPIDIQSALDKKLSDYFFDGPLLCSNKACDDTPRVFIPDLIKTTIKIYDELNEPINIYFQGDSTIIPETNQKYIFAFNYDNRQGFDIVNNKKLIFHVSCKYYPDSEFEMQCYEPQVQVNGVEQDYMRVLKTNTIFIRTIQDYPNGLFNQVG